jgi:uncharacterized protein YndB with AHSA1/START domain
MTNEDKRELTLVRIFDAPRELVWKAWTDSKLLAQWWGPNGVTNPICEFDPKPNGAIHIVMEAGEEMGEFKGTQWPMTGVLKEIVEPSRLVFTATAMTDETGKPTFENLNTVTFEEIGGKTKVTVHIQVLVLVESSATKFAFGGMEKGWTQSLEKLNVFLDKQ